MSRALQARRADESWTARVRRPADRHNLRSFHERKERCEVVREHNSHRWIWTHRQVAPMPRLSEDERGLVAPILRRKTS